MKTIIDKANTRGYFKYTGINKTGDGSKWRKTKGGKCSDLSD